MLTLFQHHEIISGEGPHIRHLERLVYKPTKGGLSIPIVEGDRELVWPARGEELAEHLLCSQQLALIERLDRGLMLMASPQNKEIMTPLFGLGGFETILALADGHPGGPEAGFYEVQVGRLPEPAVDRIISAIITIMEIDQMVSPHITILRGVVKISNFLKMLAIMGSQGIVETEHAFGLHLGTGQTLQ